jgi:hypothetical protein
MFKSCAEVIEDHCSQEALTVWDPHDYRYDACDEIPFALDLPNSMDSKITVDDLNSRLHALTTSAKKSPQYWLLYGCARVRRSHTASVTQMSVSCLVSDEGKTFSKGERWQTFFQQLWLRQYGANVIADLQPTMQDIKDGETAEVVFYLSYARPISKIGMRIAEAITAQGDALHESAFCSQLEAIPIEPCMFDVEYVQTDLGAKSDLKTSTAKDKGKVASTFQKRNVCVCAKWPHAPDMWQSFFIAIAQALAREGQNIVNCCITNIKGPKKMIE